MEKALKEEAPNANELLQDNSLNDLEDLFADDENGQLATREGE